MPGSAPAALPVAQMVVPVIHPKAYLPNHWDGLFNPFWPGMPYPFKDDALRELPAGAEGRAGRRRRSTSTSSSSRKDGVARDVNHAVKAQLGFADAQRFSQSLLDAVTQVASTSLGDDCGEGFLEPSPWATAFARLDRPALAPPAPR